MYRTSCLALALMALPAFGAAQSYGDPAYADPTYDNPVRADILPGWRTPAGDHIAAIRLTLAPGWITYWRAPGDAGIPSQFTWSGSDGITAITPHWPTPQIIDDKGMRAIGYSGSVIFPITVQADSAGPLAISGALSIGVCAEVCIPVTLDIDTLLPPDGAYDPAITTALDARPLSQSAARVGDVVCNITPISDGLRVTTMIDIAATGASEFVVVEAGDPAIWVSQADVSRDGRILQATVDMVHVSGAPFALDRSDVRMTVLGDDKAVDIQGCLAG